jgi:hypothetical protein
MVIKKHKQTAHLSATARHCLLPTAYFSATARHCLLPTAHLSATARHCLLPTAHFSATARHCLLPTAYFSATACHCLLPTFQQPLVTAYFYKFAKICSAIALFPLYFGVLMSALSCILPAALLPKRIFAIAE